MRNNRFLDYLAYLVVRLCICIVQSLSMEMCHTLARTMAWLCNDLFRIRGRVVEENLTHAFPDLTARQRRDLSRGMWEHLFLMVFEIAHAPRKIHESNWRQHVQLNGSDPLVLALLDDRPTVIVTGHVGNFEVGGFVLGILGFPTFTVARNLDNPFLDRWLMGFRAATGQYIIPKNGGYDQILAVLGAGGTMTFLADQYAGPKGCWVDFFGRKASAHKAIALLSLENDAPVAVCCSRRAAKPLHFEVQVVAMADPRKCRGDIGTIHEMTQWYTDWLEKVIREQPNQYWWLHRRWKDPRKPKRAIAKAA